MPPRRMRIRIGESGVVSIPEELLRAAGLEGGDAAGIWVEDGEIRILGVRQGIEWAQRLMRQYVPEGRSLVDELIAERRREAAREDE